MMIAKLILMSYLTFPSLSLAMGSVESNLNPIIHGDRGKSIGAFQIQPRHHGPVPKNDFRGQMVVHDRILLELLQAVGDLPEAVGQYNGGKKNLKYIKKVRREAFLIELIGGV